MDKMMWSADLGNGTYKNPILYTDYSDPDAIRAEDDYFMISSSFSNAPAIPLLHSKDLVNWKVINYVCGRIPEERYQEPVHGCGVWAPAIRFHGGYFWVCFPMPDEGIYMSKTKDPWGVWPEPVNIRPGAGWIDPCPFWDDDGKAYLTAGVAKSRIGYKSVLHLVEMKPDGSGVFGEEVKIFDGNLNDQTTIEGPKLYKRNGYYYIFAPAGGVKEGWQTVLRAKNIRGPYEYKVVLRQGTTGVNGPHQGAWVDTQTGQDWFLHFQDVYAAGRIVHLQPMRWEDDWPIIGEVKDGNDYGEPVSVYKKPDVNGTYPATEPDNSDEFTGEALGMQWQWNANFDRSWYEIDTIQKRLNLFAVSKESERPLGDVKNLLLQKWPSAKFACTAKIDISHLQEQDTAGIVSMGMIFGALAVTRNNGIFELITICGTQEFNGQKAVTTQEKKTVCEIQTTEVYFQYEVKENGIREIAETKNAPLEKITLSYSTDGEKYMSVISFDSMPGRWVGVKNGVFCYHEGESGASRGYASVEYFRYRSI